MGILSKPDLTFEPKSVLNADAFNLQALIAQVDLVLSAAHAAKGKAIVSCAEGAIDDFAAQLSDLRSDLHSTYSNIEAELDRRDGELEREHERIEAGMLTRHLSAAE